MFYFFSFVDATLDCDFSSKYMCGYSVPEDTQYTWARAKGRTPSLNTGPDFDHTSLSPDGKTNQFKEGRIQDFRVFFFWGGGDCYI